MQESHLVDAFEHSLKEDDIIVSIKLFLQTNLWIQCPAYNQRYVGTQETSHHEQEPAGNNRLGRFSGYCNNQALALNNYAYYFQVEIRW